MAFDLATARPVTQNTGGFDISTAQPVGQKTPQPTTEKPVRRIGRSGRSQELRADRTQTESLIERFEAGEVSSADLTPRQAEKVRRARIESIPEISETGVQALTGGDALESVGTAAVGLTAFDPAEFGRILTEQFPDIGVVTTPEGEQIAVNNKTGVVANLNSSGLSPMDLMQTLGVVAAFTPSGKAASAAPAAASKLIGRQVASQTGTKALAGGATAIATEAGIQAAQEAAGGEFNTEDVALAGGLGGAAELVQPAIKSAGRSIRSALRGTEETAEQATRRAALEAEGLVPTRAQVTRNAKEFQQQQSIAKRDPSGPVAARLEQQESRLQGAFEKRALDTSGDVVTSTSTPIDEVLERSITLDDQIGKLYRQAAESAPDAQNIRLESLARDLKRLSGEENISGGLISSIRNNLRNRGIIDKQGRVAGRVSVDVAEQVRQDINALFDSVSDRGRQLSRSLKDSLDDDVLKQSGGDFFDQARSAKRSFEQGLDRAKISKFDKRKQNIVRDMLDNKINPDTFVDDTVFAKKWRSEDLSQLKSYLNQTEKGRRAWDDVRAQVIDQIKEKSFTGPVRGDGVTRSLSRAALEKTLSKLSSKANVLFNADERAFFNRMKAVAKLREPTPGQFQGGGPTEVAVSEIKNRFPVLGPIFESLSQFKQNKLLLSLPKKKLVTGPSRRIPTQPAQAIRQTTTKEGEE